MEALFRLQRQAFVQWLSDKQDSSSNKKDVADKIKAYQDVVRHAEEFSEAFRELRLPESMSTINTKLTEFKADERKVLQTFAFWDDYISMVQLLLQFIKAK